MKRKKCGKNRTYLLISDLLASKEDSQGRGNPSRGGGRDRQPEAGMLIDGQPSRAKDMKLRKIFEAKKTRGNS